MPHCDSGGRYVKHAEQCRHDENASIAILNVGRMNDGVEQEA
jgi:hypothetical protein